MMMKMGHSLGHQRRGAGSEPCTVIPRVHEMAVLALLAASTKPLKKIVANRSII
jgi:hypothetical protein